MNIILLGACGKMGKNVTEVCGETGDAIVCGIDLHPCEMPFPVYTDFAEVKERADVLIDFSSPVNLKKRLEYCESHRLPVLLAATGYSEDDLKLIDEFSERIAIFKTGNLSLGVNLLQLLAKKAAAVLKDFDAEIIERHHNQKKDAPSGTALMLANSVNEGFENGKEFVFGRHGMVGARSEREIGIHAIRGGTIVGEHEVMFAGTDEIITLSHSARSRKVFASGALKAAAWLIGKPAGLYDMSDMLQGIV